MFRSTGVFSRFSVLSATSLLFHCWQVFFLTYFRDKQKIFVRNHFRHFSIHFLTSIFSASVTCNVYDVSLVVRRLAQTVCNFFILIFLVVNLRVGEGSEVLVITSQESL